MEKYLILLGIVIIVTLGFLGFTENLKDFSHDATFSFYAAVFIAIALPIVGMAKKASERNAG
jgi:hypothetical protein